MHTRMQRSTSPDVITITDFNKHGYVLINLQMPDKLVFIDYWLEERLSMTEYFRHRDSLTKT